MKKSQLLDSLKQQRFSKQILNAFSKVKRENFIPKDMQPRAYEDMALPIGEGQTISQPYTIAMMLSILELKKNQKVLEIGSGSGYVLALISEIIKPKGKVFGIELIKSLVDKSKQNLKSYKNIEIYHKSGVLGLNNKALFDRILISAACDEIPKYLFSQLKDNAIIVAPVGSRDSQSLFAIQKINNKLIIRREIPGFVFVPFIKD